MEKNADFFHYIDNETGDGLEYNDFPFDKVPSHQPIVCDMSSSFLTKPIDWTKFGMVYASAQKQAGVANVCICVVRKDLIGCHQPQTPATFAWQSYSETATLDYMPNTWGIYMITVWVDHQLNLGGLGEMQARAQARSTPLYRYIDSERQYYRNIIEP